MFDPARFCVALSHAPFHLGDTAKAARAGQILDAAQKHNANMDPRWLAYEFATGFWETEWTLEPIREIGCGRGQPYGIANPYTGQVYYGRGLVQTTWYANYLKLKRLLGVDCVMHPDLLLQMQYAAPALFVGLEEGIYSGRRLGQFFNDHVEDPVQARRMVNGLDHADAIASLYWPIKHALGIARLAE